MLTHWWVADAWQQGPIYLLAQVFWVIFSIVLHELAHGWTAIRCGDRTPIETGHMTWNPVVHMGQSSLIMFALVGIAWGAMPVNPANFRGRYDNAKVALAGPSMNLLLFAVALCACVAVKMWGGSLEPHTERNLFAFCFIGALFNMALAILNLLPLPPLDGWRIVSDFWPGYGAIWNGGNAPMLAIGILVAMFVFGGRIIFGAAGQVTVVAMKFLIGAIGGGP